MAQTAYITYSNVIENDPKLDNENIIAQAKIENYILSASGLVDAYLECIYSIPFNPVPELIKEITLMHVHAKAYRFMALKNDIIDSEAAQALQERADEQLFQLRGDRTDPDKPFQPLLFMPGVPLKRGIIRTETDSLIYVQSEGTGSTLWSNTMNKPPDTRILDSNYWRSK